MEEYIAFSFFGSAIWFGLIVLALLGSFIWAEVEENGFGAAISLGVVLIINHFWGNFPVMEYISWAKIGIYIGIGFAFAIIRTFFKGRHLKGKHEEYVASTEQWNKDRDEAKMSAHKIDTREEYNKKNFDLKGHIFRWWFLFPVSMMSWFLGSVIKDVYNYLYTHIGGLFERILNM